jgi:hypothetical protein
VRGSSMSGRVLRVNSHTGTGVVDEELDVVVLQVSRDHAHLTVPAGCHSHLLRPYEVPEKRELSGVNLDIPGSARWILAYITPSLAVVWT